MDFNIINLWPTWTKCAICYEDCLMEYNLPMYESEIVDVNKTSEWAGMSVCEKCYIKNNGDDIWDK